jgi:hypothetical protein
MLGVVFLSVCYGMATLRGTPLTEDQETGLWTFVSDLLDEHDEVIRRACVDAIQGLGPITGRD